MRRDLEIGTSGVSIVLEIAAGRSLRRHVAMHEDRPGTLRHGAGRDIKVAWNAPEKRVAKRAEGENDAVATRLCRAATAYPSLLGDEIGLRAAGHHELAGWVITISEGLIGGQRPRERQDFAAIGQAAMVSG